MKAPWHTHCASSKVATNKLICDWQVNIVARSYGCTDWATAPMALLTSLLPICVYQTLASFFQSISTPNMAALSLDPFYSCVQCTRHSNHCKWGSPDARLVRHLFFRSPARSRAHSITCVVFVARIVASGCCHVEQAYRGERTPLVGKRARLALRPSWTTSPSWLEVRTSFLAASAKGQPW